MDKYHKNKKLSYNSVKVESKLKRDQELSQQMDRVKQQRNALKQDLDQQQVYKNLLAQINQWENDSIAKIRSTAESARTNLKIIIQEPINRIRSLTKQLSKECRRQRRADNYTESDIERWTKSLEAHQLDLKKMSAIKLTKGNLPSLPLITIEKEHIDSSLANVVNSEGKSMEKNEPALLLTDDYSMSSKQKSSTLMAAGVHIPKYPYSSASFYISQSKYPQIYRLFEYLRSLAPMDKNGSMSGDCDHETTQMEKFLSKTFDFKNLDGECIVQGVKSFRLGKPIHLMDPNMMVYFPSETNSAFVMSVQEIFEWQRSYRVYAARGVEGMDTKFLQRALQGLSESGKEAFLMKFVVRISQCPILMEFDAKVISRPLEEQWPNRIKLVSVTGIDFAGRIHDVDDICTYVSNWKDVYVIDDETKLPRVYNGRDFCRRNNGPLAKLDEKLLLDDLMRMTRLRLRACDQEKVQIVVETGIGLGVFAGRSIGIDETVRKLSAFAIRSVLEEDGPSYKHILGVVFALPVFEADQRNGQRQDTYYAFFNGFSRDNYRGPIPILIADQDMHRLTVAIALEGYTVSELNPADSHGVFGEYWQNRGPAVEEKLALTTLGLLVQHHLINPQVLDPNHYQFI
jgi:hypothetical protein